MLNELKFKENNVYFAQELQSLTQENENYNLFNILKDIVNYRFCPDDTKDPYKPMCIMDNRRSNIHDDLSDEDLEILQNKLDMIEQNELKARVYDILFLKGDKRQKQENAKNALKYFMYAINDRFQDDDYVDIPKLLNRCFGLFKFCGFKKPNIIIEVDYDINQFIIIIYKKTKELDNNSSKKRYLFLSLVEIIDNYKIFNFLDYPQDLQEYAEYLEKQKDFRFAGQYWFCASKFYDRIGNENEAQICKINYAETFMKLADLNLDPLMLSFLYKEALEAYNKYVKGEQDRKKEINDLLIQIGKQIPSQLQEFTSPPIDITKSRQFAIDQVKNKSKLEAISSLASLLHLSSFEQVKKEVEDKYNNYPLQAISKPVIYDSEGKTIFDFNKWATIEEECYYHVSTWSVPLHVPIYFDPAWQQIYYEHNFSVQDFIDISKIHPFIPLDRVYSFSKGLYHGFNGDFMEAAHILTPQIENSLRYLLNSNNEQTLKFKDDKGVQEEKGINTVLEQLKLKNILSPRLIFNLKGFLCEKSGNNFRHNLMHGLLPDEATTNYQSKYLFWITLYILFFQYQVKFIELI